jgi:hypothetical protein
MLLLKKFSLRNIELAVSIKLAGSKVKTNIAEFALVYWREVFSCQTTVWLRFSY